MKRLSLILMTYTLFAAYSFAQLETHRWYFTNTSTRGITFDFITNNPVNTAEHVNPYSNEGSGVANHPLTGSLLFYVTTNQIRDAFHATMPNGNSITNHTSNSQKGIICPRPGFCNQYYVFQNTSSREDSPGSLYYSLVDLTLPGNGTIITPRGDIVAGQKNIFLKNNTGEAACLVKSTQTNVFWLIISTYDPNEISIYKIDSSGIGFSSNYNVPFVIDDYRQFVFSHENNKFVLTSCTEANPTLIFDFNRTSGTITSCNPVPGTPLGGNPNYWTGMIGAEWSADGTKLYLGKYRWPSGVTGGGVYQYDLNLPANPIQVVFMNGGGYNNVVQSMKRAPNGEIYFIYDHPSQAFRYLGKINNPNNAGPACNIVPLGHDLGYNVSPYTQFPHHIPSNEKPMAQNDSIQLSCADTIYPPINILSNDYDPDDDQFALNFYGLPSEINLTVNPNQTVGVTFNGVNSGTYVLPYTICDLKCFSKCDTAYLVLQFDSIVSANFLSPAIQFCQGDTVFISSSMAGNSYLWNTGDTAASIFADIAGIYSLEVKNGNCHASDTTLLIALDQPLINLGTDIVVCDTNLYQISLSGVIESYLWSTGDTTSSINVSANGIYWIEASNICGADIDTISVEFNSSPSANLLNSQNICLGDTANLNVVSNDANIIWNTGDTSNSISTTLAGTYWVSLTNICGNDVDSAIIYMLPDPVLNNLGNDTMLCNATAFVLNATAFGDSLIWSTGDTANYISISNSGTYWLQVSTTCGTITDSIIVNMETSPDVNTNNDTTICLGDVINLLAISSEPNVIWSTGDSSLAITVNTAGTYWVTSSNNCGTDLDSVLVQMGVEPYINLGNDTMLCNAPSFVLNATAVGDNLIWSNGSTNSTITINSNGTYWATVSNLCGSDTDSIVVQMNTQPNIDLGDNIAVCEGDTVILNATWTNSTYVWSNLNTNSTISITSSGNYWVQVTNECGTTEDSLQAEFKSSVGNFPLPNVFTPNANGVNDTYQITPLQDASSFTLYIYDRWGVLIYSTNSTSAPWNGTTTDNKPVPAGVYFVILQYENCNKMVETKTGSVTVFY